MIFCRVQYIIAITSLISSCVCGVQELLKNSTWEKTKNNIPTSWRFITYKEESTIKLTSEKFKNKKVACIDSDNLKGRGFIGQRLKVQLPAGKNIVLSGYYRTENIALGPKGMLRASIKYNNGGKDENFPRKNQAIVLKPSKKWQKFEIVKTIDAPIKDFNAIFILYRASGKIYFNGLSLKIQESSSKIDSQEKYVWREAEGIRKFSKASNWGKEIKNYYSGKGGIILKKEPFKWNFKIKEEVDPHTLIAKERNYFVWIRIYGYLEKPAVSVFFNKAKISSFKTQANEKVNAQGQYAAPGKYYWQKAGSFRAIGGNAYLNIISKGRMLLDAVIVTTDSKYAPAQYEAKKVAEKDFFTDVHTEHAIKAVYKVYGINDKIITPVVFRFQGIKVKIPNNQKAAVFHVSMPANLVVKNISSVWAGKNWNRPARWGEKYLTWKKVGEKNVSGVKHNKYDIYLYNLALYYTIFVQADKTDFRPGQKLSCEYYLEYKGKKQLVEMVQLRAVSLKATKAFKKIMIGPAGGNASGFYESFPNITKALVFSGFNVVNPWHINPKSDGGRWIAFRNECIKNKIVLLGEHSPFAGAFKVKDKKFQAVSLTGKLMYGRPPGGRPALCINEEDASFRKNLDYLREKGEQGITGMVLDDEYFNQQKDKFEYNTLTKEKFRKYTKKLGINYIDPVSIVKNKKKYAAQYKAWVDFKCDCMVEIYSKFRKAYLEGFAKAPSSTTFGKKLFIPQILKNKTPEESRINTYWDYKKLSKYCDYISPMIYCHQGIKDSAEVGDIIEMYNKYIGKKIIAPTLQCEYPGSGHTDMTQKKMFKYQILESLMQQSEMILFWVGPAMMNPINSQHISEAIRWASPYEDIILNGKEYKDASSNKKWVRIKGLKLGKRILLYVANYRNSISQKAQIKLKGKAKSVLEIGTGKQSPVSNNSFPIGFESDRGKLFLITQ
jgi:hypothetical protein